MDSFLPLIVTSPSGAGKTTLVRRLLAAEDSLVVSVSYTTRAPRSGEVDGRDYHFVDEATFDAMLDRGAFAEYANVHGRRYGTSIERVREARDTHRGMVFVIDYQGAAQVKSRIDGAVGVFILPPSLQELEARLRGRGTESDEAVARRLANARTEMQHAGGFEYVVVNDDLERASDELLAVARVELARRGVASASDAHRALAEQVAQDRRSALAARVLAGERVALR